MVGKWCSPKHYRSAKKSVEHQKKSVWCNAHASEHDTHKKKQRNSLDASNAIGVALFNIEPDIVALAKVVITQESQSNISRLSLVTAILHYKFRCQKDAKIFHFATVNLSFRVFREVLRKIRNVTDHRHRLIQIHRCAQGRRWGAITAPQGRELWITPR